jgi:hexosaminidase
LETFLQLIEGDQNGYFVPSVSIQDKPRFAWRGLLIDSCRHFQPVEVIKRELDGMAAVKLNVLHWHLTEDQGFRVEVHKYPKLHQMGSDGLYYTQDEIREVVAYATDRGIRVVPEFDMPGHVTSWLVGYPELGSAPGPYQIIRQWGIFDGAFDPTRDEVYKFIDGFLGEMAALFPDAYMHIGGDESNGKQWKQNPKIQAFMKEKNIKDTEALQSYFTAKVQTIVAKHKKRMIGWDEIYSPEMPKNIVIHSWRGPESLAKAAANGYAGILSSGYYLDHMRPASFHYAVDPIPANTTLTDQQKELILGGEACMWAEYVSPETIDSRIWPRLGAIAERLWSPGSITDVDDMYRRTAALAIQLEVFGLNNETTTDRLMRNLAGSSDISSLKTLVELVEPLQGYNRGKAHPSTQMTPLTRMVDAAKPESATGRWFAKSVDEFLSDAPNFRAHRDDMTASLNHWRDVNTALVPMFERSPVLREAEPLAKDLSLMSQAGLDAISHLSSSSPATPEWRDATLAMLAEAAKHDQAAVGLSIITSIKQLVIAAAELDQLKTSSPAEWSKHIKSLANERPRNGRR